MLREVGLFAFDAVGQFVGQFRVRAGGCAAWAGAGDMPSLSASLRGAFTIPGSCTKRRAAGAETTERGREHGGCLVSERVRELTGLRVGVWFAQLAELPIRGGLAVVREKKNRWLRLFR
jgi:hypothetical protein